MATLIFYQRILYSRGWSCVSQHFCHINRPFFNARRLALREAHLRRNPAFCAVAFTLPSGVGPTSRGRSAFLPPTQVCTKVLLRTIRGLCLRVRASLAISNDQSKQTARWQTRRRILRPTGLTLARFRLSDKLRNANGTVQPLATASLSAQR